MTDPQSPNVLPLSPEDLTFWRSEIERARKLRDDTISQWDAKGNLERYTPKSVLATAGTRAIDAKINVAKDYSDVERKKAALFYDVPAIALIPDPGTDPNALPLHQELLNSLLSEKRMDVKSTVLPTIQDCLVVIQPCPTEIGYSSVSVDVPEMIDQPAPPDPMTGLPIPGAMPIKVPSGKMIPVIVYEKFFWERISPKAQLQPASLKNSKYDEAPWQGHDWELPATEARRLYKFGEDISGAALPERPFFCPLGEQPDDTEPKYGGVKLWYRAVYRDPAVVHPEVIRELVLMEGYDTPLVHRNCPYQDIGPDGRLTPNSIIGFPEHSLSMRYLTDSPYAAADCTLTAPLTRELNKSRTLNINQRDASKLHILYDPSRLNQESRDKIEDGDEPKFIAVTPGSLDAGMDKVMQQVPAITQGRESFLHQEIIERDRDGILGMNQNTQNPRAQGGKTATEITAVQRNTDARFEQERLGDVSWFLKGVQKLSALVLRYGDRIAVEILGPDRGQQWIQARDAGQFGRFSFETVMDSGVYVDIEGRKRQSLELYNMTAQDPTLNRGVIQRRLATDFGINPAEWIAEKPPEQKPEQPTVSISVKPEDLDPSLPSYVGTYAILTAAGVKNLPPPQPIPIPVAPPAPNEPDHGGMADLQPRLNQHQLSESGEPPGPKVM
jgi:hypothetical protein